MAPQRGSRPPRPERPGQPWLSGHLRIALGEELENLAAETPQNLLHRRTGQVGTAGPPVPHRGQRPAFTGVGEPPQGHPQQGRSAGWPDNAPWCRGQAQLHQHGAALNAGAPAGEMEGEVEGFGLAEGAGEGIVAPGMEIGPGIGEMLPEQGRRRGDGLGQFHGSNLIGGIHDFHPAARGPQVGR